MNDEDRTSIKTWTNADLYDMRTTLSGIIASGVDAFRKSTSSYPAGLSLDKWEQILTDISFGFQVIADDAGDEELNELFCLRGLDLFKEWFLDLWD